MKKIVGLGIIGFILVVGSISVGATSTVPSDGVLYSDSGKTVKEALDELFTELGDLKKIGTASEADILQDKTALVQGIEIKGQMANNGYGGTASSVIDYNNYLYYRIPVGYYSVNSSHGLSEVKASYSSVASALGITSDKLAKGQSVLGVSGTYTSDATASAANILSGKTAYINGSKTTGTMANNGAVNKTGLTAGSSYTIPAGYHNGSGKVTAATLASQTSATATAAQILNGYTAWKDGNKITGTMAQRSASNVTLSSGSSKTYSAGYYPSSWTVTAKAIETGETDDDGAIISTGSVAAIAWSGSESGNKERADGIGILTLVGAKKIVLTTSATSGAGSKSFSYTLHTGSTGESAVTFSGTKEITIEGTSYTKILLRPKIVTPANGTGSSYEARIKYTIYY